MINDILRDTEAGMKKSIESLRSHLSTIRTGRASPGLVEHLHVEAYESTMPLNQLASITVPEAKMIIIQPYDATMIKAIEKAIQTSELGLNPNNDGRMIRLVLPQMTQERRRELVKLVKARVEEGRVVIRNQRRDALDMLRELESEKEIGEDDLHRGQERLQQVTDNAIKELELVGAAKEAEVMEV